MEYMLTRELAELLVHARPRAGDGIQEETLSCLVNSLLGHWNGMNTSCRGRPGNITRLDVRTGEKVPNTTT